MYILISFLALMVLSIIVSHYILQGQINKFKRSINNLEEFVVKDGMKKVMKELISIADEKEDKCCKPKKSYKSKKCSQCPRTRSLKHFYTNKRAKDGRHAMCKDCFNSRYNKK